MKPRRGQTAGENPKLECQNPNQFPNLASSTTRTRRLFMNRGVRSAELPSLRIVVSCVIAAGLCPAFAQEARLVNVRMQTRAVASSLENEFQTLVKDQAEPAWIGYAVPVVAGNHSICCYSSEDRHKPAALRHGRCKLEGRDEGMNFQNNDDDERISPLNSL